MKKSLTTLAVVLFGLTTGFAQEKGTSEKGKSSEAALNLQKAKSNDIIFL
jgi:hypothetical protein